MYFITTIEVKRKQIKDTRCVGYYSKFDEAEKVVLSNSCDICETCYDYAVIENIPEGLYQYDFHPTWYKYQKLVGGYTKCENLPDFIKAIDVGYAIG